MEIQSNDPQLLAVAIHSAFTGKFVISQCRRLVGCFSRRSEPDGGSDGRVRRPPVRVNIATPSEFSPRRGPQNSPGRRRYAMATLILWYVTPKSQPRRRLCEVGCF